MSTILTVTLGRDDRFDLQALNPDGTPRDLSACAVLFGVKLSPDAVANIAAGLGAGVIFTDRTLGKFAVLLPPIAKIGLSSLTFYYWDVLVIDRAGLATTPPGLSGTLFVEDSITPVSLDSTMQPPANISFHPEITTLVGGGATALNGVNTTALSRPCLYIIRIGGQRQEWMLRTRTDADVPDDLDVVPAANALLLSPADRDPVTNNVIWERTA